MKEIVYNLVFKIFVNERRGVQISGVRVKCRNVEFIGYTRMLNFFRVKNGKSSFTVRSSVNDILQKT